MTKEEINGLIRNCNVVVGTKYILKGSEIEFIVTKLDAQPNSDNVKNYHLRVSLESTCGNHEFSEEISSFKSRFTLLS